MLFFAGACTWAIMSGGTFQLKATVQLSDDNVFYIHETSMNYEK
mgnify:CR=1 FL=1